jgi:hypothetical protein
MTTSIQSRSRCLLAAWIGLFFVAMCGIVMGDTDTLRKQLFALRTATRVVVMVVYPGSLFAVNVHEGELPYVSCVFQIENGAGTAFDEVAKMLDAGIIVYRVDSDAADSAVRDKRIAIVFQNGESTLQTFYFGDWGFGQNIEGVSGNYRFLASVDFQNRLRKLLLRKDVVLIERRGQICSFWKDEKFEVHPPSNN